jgi:hypothetical protein
MTDSVGTDNRPTPGGVFKSPKTEEVGVTRLALPGLRSSRGDQMLSLPQTDAGRRHSEDRRDLADLENWCAGIHRRAGTRRIRTANNPGSSCRGREPG